MAHWHIKKVAPRRLSSDNPIAVEPAAKLRSKGQDREDYNAYMREYMRDYRNRQRRGHVGQPKQPRDPIFDPRRDGAPCFESLTAVLLGDPPIGRRAIDKIAEGSNGPR